MKTTVPESNFLTAVLTGIIITIIAGVALFPVILLAFVEIFELYVFTDPPPNAWAKDTLIIVIFCAWLFVATAIGGWACAGASTGYEHSHALFLSVLWIVIALLFYFYFAYEEPFVTSILVAALGVTGYFVGTGLRIRKKRKSPQMVK